MILTDFIAKWDSKGIDFDNAFSTQCMDLYRQYVKEVLSFPQSPPVAGAKDVWDTYLPEYFKKVENTPFGVPEKGDIIIWGTGIGKFGHIAIFVEGTAAKFKSFDQNFPVGSLCHIQNHTYKGVLGWIKPILKELDMPEWLKTLLQERNLTIENEPEIRSLFDKAKRYDDEISQLKEQVISANEALADRAREVSMLTEANQKLSNRVTEAEELFNTTKSERDQATWEVTKLEVRIKMLDEEIVRISEEIDNFKEANDILAYGWLTRLFSLFRTR